MGALTAQQALFDHGGLARGQAVAVLGAAGGVGTFAVQLARAAGAPVVAVARPWAWRRERCRWPFRGSRRWRASRAEGGCA